MSKSSRRRFERLAEMNLGAELDRAWTVKWMKTVREKHLLMDALRVFIESLDGDLDGLLIAKLNAQSVLKKVEGE